MKINSFKIPKSVCFLIFICLLLVLIEKILSLFLWHEGFAKEKGNILSDKDADCEEVEWPLGLYEVNRWKSAGVANITNSTTGRLEYDYYKFINTVSLQCLHQIRLGNFDDGGWDVCLAGPFKPKKNRCLVYSFGINNDWSFDDDVVKSFGCKVRAFDPTMSNYSIAKKRGAKIFFYPVGIYGHDGLLEIGRHGKLPVKTLATIRKEHGDVNKIIDYLKMDVEESEWSALEAILKQEFLSKYVKQIGIEFHSQQVKDKADTYIRILTELEAAGFRKWKVHWNMHCLRKTTMNLSVSVCHEVYYLNINFLKKNQDKP